MTAARIAKLQAAADYVSLKLREGVASAEIITGLVAIHGASYATDRDPYRLRVAGVAATCTWSRDHGLLDAWRRNATRHLWRERLA